MIPFSSTGWPIRRKTREVISKKSPNPKWHAYCTKRANSEFKPGGLFMKRLTTLTVFCSVFVLTLTLTAAPLQNPPQAPPGGPGAGAPAPGGPGAQAPPSAEKTFTGTLSKVDAAAKEITLKGSDNKEMIFTWNEQTKISGVEGPQGLAGAKAGSNLKVMYRENRGANLATQIDVQK